MMHNTDSSFFPFDRVIAIKLIMVAIFIIADILISFQVCRAGGDLDDDISKYKDDPISKWDELGKDSVNINFIIVKALGRMKLTDKNVNINSVVVGPGANVGDIYNIHLNDSAGGPVIPNNADEQK